MLLKILNSNELNHGSSAIIIKALKINARYLPVFVKLVQLTKNLTNSTNSGIMIVLSRRIKSKEADNAAICSISRACVS